MPGEHVDFIAHLLRATLSQLSRGVHVDGGTAYAILAPGGSGKTTAAHLLREEAADTTNVTVVYFRPTAEASSGRHDTLLTLVQRHLKGTGDEPATVPLLVEELRANNQHLLLIVDDMENLFLSRGSPANQATVADLFELSGLKQGQVAVVLLGSSDLARKLLYGGLNRNAFGEFTYGAPTPTFTLKNMPVFKLDGVIDFEVPLLNQASPVLVVGTGDPVLVVGTGDPPGTPVQTSFVRHPLFRFITAVVLVFLWAATGPHC
jgi:hypothetical protein